MFSAAVTCAHNFPAVCPEQTFVGRSGRRYAGEALVRRIWDQALAQSLGASRSENRNLELRAIEAALEGHPRAGSLLEEFHALGDVRPGADGSWLENAKPETDA